MSELLHLAGQMMLEMKRVGVDHYMRTLNSDPPAEPTEKSVNDFVGALKLSGIPWAEAQADFAAMTERRRLEARIKAANAAWDKANASYTEAAAAHRAFVEEKVRIIGDTRAVSHAQTMAEAEREIGQARKELDTCEAKLRELRLAFPRAFNVYPELTI